MWFREEGLSVPLRKVPPGLPERLLGMNVIAGLPWEATFRCISRMPCKGFRTRRSLRLNPKQYANTGDNRANFQ